MTIASRPLAFAIATFIPAAFITALVVPCVKALGLQLGVTDQPNSRKQHINPVVRIGGVAMVIGFCLALSITWGLGGFGLLAPAKDQLIWSTLVGALCFFVIGLADDLFALSPWPRLFGQIAISLAL